MEPKVFERAEGDEVMVLSTLRLETKAGEVWAREMVQIVRVDRDKGVIVEITPFQWDVRG
jgi:hypothetical protein